MDALILMTRIPIAGQTKTRLMDTLTGEECALLHRAFLKDLMRVCHSLKKVMDIDVYLYFTPSHASHIIEDILVDDMRLFSQNGGSLGDIMLFAFEEIFKKDYHKVILIGSDIPQIQSSDILTSFRILDESDVVLGPTFDGGYYLIGMKLLQNALFKDLKTWGKGSVFQETVDKALSMKLKISSTKKLVDIDTKEDLMMFYHSFEDFENNLELVPVETIKYMKEIRRII